MEAHVTDSPFQIASILIISNDDWDILAPSRQRGDASNSWKLILVTSKQQVQKEIEINRY